MMHTSSFYWLFTLLLIDVNSLLWHSIWGWSLTFTTPNITPFATYYHIGTRGDVWWLDFNYYCPPYGSDIGSACSPTQADAERIGNDRDYLGNIAATKTSSRRHRCIRSIVVVWGRRISVCVHIWGRFRWCQMCRFYVCCVHVIIQPKLQRFSRCRRQKRIQHKILGQVGCGCRCYCLFMADNALWCIMVEVFLWGVSCDFLRSPRFATHRRRCNRFDTPNISASGWNIIDPCCICIPN